jgi:NAD(P)-dependent dehydrogenase (short-subunit alcohol dehydrogenase family)
VNVTSAEGVFNMDKRGIHPHTSILSSPLTHPHSFPLTPLTSFIFPYSSFLLTKIDMAKAALNMMTKSISSTMAATNIFTTAVGIIILFYLYIFIIIFIPLLFLSSLKQWKRTIN